MHVLLTHRPVYSTPIRSSLFAHNVSGRLLAWAAACVLLRPDLMTAVLWLAVLVLVPEGMRLGRELTDSVARRPALAGWPAFLAGMLVVAASALPVGWLAGLLALPWLAIALLGAGLATMRLARFPRSTVIANALDVAALLLLVGAGWIVVGRLGWRFGFTDEIVRLTAVHFHYAGFLLPTLATCAAWRRPRWSTTATLATVTLGFGLVALGIAFSPVLEVVGAAAMVFGCTALAVEQLRAGLATRRPEIFAPLALSSAALAAGMALAAVFALGEYLGRPWIDIPTMIPTHGLANAVGFTGCGLLGWRRLMAYDLPRRRRDAE